MKTFLSHFLLTLAVTATSFASSLSRADEKVLNLYSARHYQTDEALYEGFTRETGIRIKRIEGKDDELLERILNEGAYSPADVLLTVDAARLSAAHELGLFAPVSSPLLDARIPANLRTADWFSFSTPSGWGFSRPPARRYPWITVRATSRPRCWEWCRRSPAP